jgi:hypothetical protein
VLDGSAADNCSVEPFRTLSSRYFRRWRPECRKSLVVRLRLDRIFFQSYVGRHARGVSFLGLLTADAEPHFRHGFQTCRSNGTVAGLADSIGSFFESAKCLGNLSGALEEQTPCGIGHFPALEHCHLIKRVRVRSIAARGHLRLLNRNGTTKGSEPLSHSTLFIFEALSESNVSLHGLPSLR